MKEGCPGPTEVIMQLHLQPIKHSQSLLILQNNSQIKSGLHSPFQPQREKCIRRRHSLESNSPALGVGRRWDKKGGQLFPTWFCQLLSSPGLLHCPDFTSVAPG